jgi:cell wall-associated NlpC family hydrolase
MSRGLGGREGEGQKGSAAAGRGRFLPVLLSTLLLALALPATAADPAPPAEEPAVCPARPGPVDVALKYLGVKYRFGGNSIKGIDCSGLVRLVFRELGVVVPQQSTNQFKHGEEVQRENLLPGDLIFFKDTYRKGISHVAIYIGGSKFIHASRHGVAIASLNEGYFNNRYAGARRVMKNEAEAIFQASLTTE